MLVRDIDHLRELTVGESGFWAMTAQFEVIG